MISNETSEAVARRAIPGSLASSLVTVALGALTLAFGITHISHFLRTGKPTGLVFAAQELVLVGVFLVRRRPLAVSRRPLDWAAALLGAYGVLLLRPTGTEVLGLGWLWLALQVAGGLGAIVCIVRLGRSFGIVAANRGVRCDGPYAVVRHPMYAFYLLGQVGYLLGAFSLLNGVVLALAVGGQLVRIQAEERVLSGDEAYVHYRRRVAFRLVPGVY